MLRANAIIGLSGLALVVLVAFAGAVASPYGALETDFLNRFSAPSASHWFGTDEYGRDVFTRVAVGSFVTLRVSLAAVVLAVTAGALIGATAAYFGGWLDRGTQMFLAMAEAGLAWCL